MRSTTHHSRTNASGRVHGTKHNDRNFDVSRADNIDPSKSEQNWYRKLYPDIATFEEVEAKFYNDTFGTRLDEVNAKYRAQGHQERCCAMDEWRKKRQNAPEETIIQVGRKYDDKGNVIDDFISGDRLLECYLDWSKRMHEWNDEHGNPFIVLDEALHMDEAVPQIHRRVVWVAEVDGVARPGQEKALEAAGVELPHPDEMPGRRNNRKMTFDAMAREMWLDVLKEHGIEIERDPAPGKKHNRDKEQVIQDTNRELMAENDSLKRKNAALQTQVAAQKKALSVAKAEAKNFKPNTDLPQPEIRTSLLGKKSVVMSEDDYTTLKNLAAKANTQAARAKASENDKQKAENSETAAWNRVDELIATNNQLTAELKEFRQWQQQLRPDVLNFLRVVVSQAQQLWQRFVLPVRDLLVTLNQSVTWDAALEMQSGEQFDQMLDSSLRWDQLCAGYVALTGRDLNEKMEELERSTQRESMREHSRPSRDEER